MREIKFGKPMIGEEEKQAVLNVLEGDMLVHGPQTKQFEADFASFVAAPHAVSLSSCTAALHLSYFHFGIGPGDEVIAPAQSHVATVHAIEYVGAKPVFVDAEMGTGNIDIDKIEDKITDRTKAITLVHFLGMPVNMERIMEIADKHSLKVVEDCALAVGATFKGRHTGLFGHMGCFSFYPVKHFTTAEGGMLITRSGEIAEGITRKKAFGLDRTVDERKVAGVYDVNMLGFNYRMNEIQATIGVEQLKRVPGFLETREENYQRLHAGLSEIEEIYLFRSSNGDYRSSYYCLSMLLNEKLAGKRFEIVRYMNEHGVGTSVYYPKALPELKHYAEKYGHPTGAFPNAARISDTSVSLPVGPHLTIEDMDYVIEIVKQAINNVK